MDNIDDRCRHHTAPAAYFWPIGTVPRTAVKVFLLAINLPAHLQAAIMALVDTAVKGQGYLRKPVLAEKVECFLYGGFGKHRDNFLVDRKNTVQPVK